MPDYEQDFEEQMKRLNFTHLSSSPSQARPFVYYKQQHKGFEEYCADFGREPGLSAAYANTMFTENFDEDLSSVRVKVG